MKPITAFSKSTLDLLSQNKPNDFYVYCLVDPITNKIFYIGKGKGNRVFSHELFALKLQKINNSLCRSDEKIKRILSILNKNLTIKKYIINFGLSEKEAFASENTLINLMNLVYDIPLKNLIKGHGEKAYTVEELEHEFGYDPITKKDILTNKPILAVKIENGFSLLPDESIDYTIGTQNYYNLKSRTLGDWKLDQKKMNQIKYIIGINKGKDNAVISAYEVSSEFSEKKPIRNTKNSNRYRFKALSTRDDTLKKLGLYKKSISDLKFGTGSPIAYINMQ